MAVLAAGLPIAAQAADTTVCHPVAHHAVVPHKPVSHRGGGISVVIDQAKIITFPKPVKTVFVGNPIVVDVNMLDSQHAFLLGKTFGVTNLVALEADGKQISNQQVVVFNNAAAVTVNRGADQFDYFCTNAHCETAPRPGDPKAYVDNTESVQSSHEGSGVTAASTGAGSATSASNQ